MASLLPLARDLAKNPPVEVYQRIMKSYATRENEKYYATVWDEQVQRYTKDGATYAVAATCDMAAMCMMMTAVGVERIENMKSAIREAKGTDNKGKIFEDKKTGDCVFFFKQPSDYQAFAVTLRDWCLRKAPGIVQFKFYVEGSGWHTFALERVFEDKDQEPTFIVYQAYQNTYRLSDFLDLGSSKDIEAHMKRVWDDFGRSSTRCNSLEEYLNKAASPKDAEKRRKYWDSLGKGGTGYDSLEEFAKKSIERIDRTAKTIGRGSPFNQAYTKRYVIDPLTAIVAGILTNDDYVLLTASTVKKATVETPFMAVLMCDTVSPAAFQDNYYALRKSEAVTIYPELYLPAPKV